MKVLVGSIIRNGMNYVSRHAEQLKKLREAFLPYGEIDIIITENDSTDFTYLMLEKQLKPMGATILKFFHGGGAYSSVDVQERWTNIAKTWNYMLDYMLENKFEYDVFIYVESDLEWEPDAMIRMIMDLNWVDAVSPFTFIGPNFPLSDAMKHLAGVGFYDTYGMVRNGVHFTNEPPFHPDYKPDELITIERSGCATVMKGEVAENCRLSLKTAMPMITEGGYTWYLDPMATMVHP
jgi:hypothetical protein